MRVTSLSAAALGLAGSVLAQTQASLSTALGSYPDLSDFKVLLDSYPNLLAAINPGLGKLTVLVPTNEALAAYSAASNLTSIGSLPLGKLETVIKYHVIEAGLNAANFDNPAGVTVPTLLKDQQYNNRSAGGAILAQYGPDATGQVLYVQPEPIPAPSRFRVRAAAGGASIRAGLAQTATLTTIDGLWDGGYFQTVDAVLAPPQPCSSTIHSQSSLSSLDSALSTAGLWDALDHATNVTCLAPDTNAFRVAGSPENNLDPATLGKALLFHTLPAVTYTNYLTDGLTLISLAGLNVTVRIVQGDIYFNDAKVISPNVITNNGLIHVLDKVMSLNGTAPVSSPPGNSTTSKPSSATPSQTTPVTFPTPTPSKATGSAGTLFANPATVGLVVFLGAVAALT